MSPRKLSRRVPRLAECADDFAICIEFNDSVISSVDHPNVLVGRYEKTVWISDARPLLEKISVCIDDFYPLILAIPDVNVSLRVHHDTVRQIELAGPCPVLSPSFQKTSVAIELHNTRVSVSVGNIDFPVLPEGYVRGLIE